MAIDHNWRRVKLLDRTVDSAQRTNTNHTVLTTMQRAILGLKQFSLQRGGQSRSSLGVHARRLFSKQTATTRPATLLFEPTAETGFLPKAKPISELPQEFAALDDLLQRMPVKLRDGSAGLLARGAFHDEVDALLPDYTDSIITLTDKVNHGGPSSKSFLQDVALLGGLYRDFCILTSAYLLEPCDLTFRKECAALRAKGETVFDAAYGRAHSVLPAKIARPLAHMAREAFDMNPWMEYAHSYALNNWRQVDEQGGMGRENLELIRPIHGGRDEAGFILVHVALEAETGAVVRAADEVSRAVAGGDVGLYKVGMGRLYTALHTINGIRDTMWEHSRPSGYMELRTWIMGITGNTGTGEDKMFPAEGVTYEGVTPTHHSYRGETGAQSSIIPVADVLTGVDQHYPTNELTNYLFELRHYRPALHRGLMGDIKGRMEGKDMQHLTGLDADALTVRLQALDEIRRFRAGHWQFTKAYIIDNSKHPVATGGTPITTWLPNQLGATMQAMQVAFDASRHGPARDGRNSAVVESLEMEFEGKLDALRREVTELASKFGQQTY